MNLPQFQAKWRGNTNKERSASQEHFIDLCRLLGMLTPSDADKSGAFYTFEKGAAKSGGGAGFADVWWAKKFAWEYKGHKANLKAAYGVISRGRFSCPPEKTYCEKRSETLQTAPVRRTAGFRSAISKKLTPRECGRAAGPMGIDAPTE